MKLKTIINIVWGGRNCRTWLRLSTAFWCVLALTACGGLRAGAGAGALTPLERFSLPMMGTVLEVAVPEGGQGEAAARAVFEVFAAVDREMSEWKPGSPLTAVNRAAGGEPVRVPAQLLQLLRRGLEIGAATDGAFDITWAALWRLWRFEEGAPIPEDAAIAERAALVDYTAVRLDEAGGTVALPQAGMVIGLGGIAKGHALDRSAERLASLGVSDYMISAGG